MHNAQGKLRRILLLRTRVNRASVCETSLGGIMLL
jgi:hypothetical protein